VKLALGRSTYRLDARWVRGCVEYAGSCVGAAGPMGSRHGGGVGGRRFTVRNAQHLLLIGGLALSSCASMSDPLQAVKDGVDNRIDYANYAAHDYRPAC
jgi:hypothetical protein